MKKILFFIALSVSFSAKSQVTVLEGSAPDSLWRLVFSQDMEYNIMGGHVGDSLYFKPGKVRFDVLNSFSGSTPTSAVWADASGHINKTSLSSLFATTEFGSAARGLFSAGAGISYNSSTGVITNSMAAPTSDSLSTSRAFNTPYQMSTTKYVEVSICPSISPSLSLTSGQSGEVYLELSADGSTNWVSRGMIPVSNTGTLTIGLSLVSKGGGCMAALVPPTYYWRARTNNVTGTPTYAFNGGSKTTW